MRRIIKKACCMALICGLCVSLVQVSGRKNSVAKTSPYQVTADERDRFFGNSAIIGNSIGLGLKYYYDSKEPGYLGDPTMLVWGCYSFIDEFSGCEKYMLHYQGKAMSAANAVKACGAGHVFINMGTNDFNTSREQIFTNYKRYIRQIKEVNPDVDIFILGTTPTRIGKGLLNNQQINKLNKQMAELAEEKSDLYYIDINSPMKDADGRLRKDYASDGFVHLSSTAYKVWTETMVRSVRHLLRQKKKAKALVKNAEKKLTQAAYDKADEFVAELDKSRFKKELRSRLKAVKKSIESLPTATPTADIVATDAPVTPAALYLADAEEPPVETTPIPDSPATGSAVIPDPDALTEAEQAQADAFIARKVTGVSVKKNVEKRVKIAWNKVKGADSYTVLRSEKKKSDYSEIGTTRNKRYIDTKAKKRRTYFYRVQANKVIHSKTFNTKKSNAAKTYVAPKNPITVIAGECFVEGMDRIQSVFNKNHRFVAKIGVNTYTMQHSNYFSYQGQMITGIERIAYYHPDRVYFLIGANEAAWMTPSFTMKNYATMRKLLRGINKHVEIVLVKIPPFGTSSSQNIPSVTQRASFNKAYMNMADKYDDVFFCPATDVLDDGTSHLLHTYDAGDGCHWNDSGTVAVVTKMREWSKKVFHNW